MGYLAIARKWRPTRFEDLVGQEHVVQTLQNAIRMDRVAHAYLFSGARGVGKTTVARLFAMALRCDSEPYLETEEGQAIAEGRSVDVVEIDGASNNGVEAVRAIRENVAYRPSSGDTKIYIIDEVHMLSISAFNALLKTLEEPPPHVIFIFATTEVQKIPVTILSRCQRFEFRRLQNAEISRRLKEILDEEQVSFSEDALATLASYGDGSLRDSQSLLDQVLSYFGTENLKGRTLEEKELVQALGVPDTGSVTEFVAAILEKNQPGLLKSIEEVYQSGGDLKKFSERCLEEVRLLFLICLHAQDNRETSASALDISSGRFQRLSQLAQNTDAQTLERMAQILGKTISQLGWSSSPRFVLEMAAVRMASLDKLAAIEKALIEGAALTASATPQPAAAPTQAATAATPSAPATAPASTPAPTTTAPTPKPPAQAAPPAPMPSAPRPPEREAPPPPGQSSGGGNGGGGAKTWKSFVEMAMKKRPLVGALVCHGEFQRLDNGSVLLKFAEGSFYERQANDSREDIQALMTEYFGDGVRLSLGSGKEEELRSLERSHQDEIKKIKTEATHHPSVEQMKNVLGADLVDVKVKLEEIGDV